MAGELGYEINVSAVEHVALRELLLDAGRDHGLREYGFYAMNSLRLEKSFGIWSCEFTQGYTPGMTGMDRWIAWNKGAFTGREAALAEREKNTAPRNLVTLEVDAPDADASGYEPVWKDGRRVGFITSGGYGHHVGKSLAMALVDVRARAGGHGAPRPRGRHGARGAGHREQSVRPAWRGDAAVASGQGRSGRAAVAMEASCGLPHEARSAESR